MEKNKKQFIVEWLIFAAIYFASFSLGDGIMFSLAMILYNLVFKYLRRKGLWYTSKPKTYSRAVYAVFIIIAIVCVVVFDISHIPPNFYYLSYAASAAILVIGAVIEYHHNFA